MLFSATQVGKEIVVEMLLIVHSTSHGSFDIIPLAEDFSHETLHLLIPMLSCFFQKLSCFFVLMQMFFLHSLASFSVSFFILRRGMLLLWIANPTDITILLNGYISRWVTLEQRILLLIKVFSSV